jgi:hypothetical protein
MLSRILVSNGIGEVFLKMREIETSNIRERGLKSNKKGPAGGSPAGVKIKPPRQEVRGGVFSVLSMNLPFIHHLTYHPPEEESI